jgi:TonB family protein
MLPLLLLLFLLPLGVSQGHERANPLRAGIDVPQPKIFKSIPVSYPRGEGDESHIVLTILIDEQGAVTEIADAREHMNKSAFQEVAKSAVKDWRFSPTFVNGKAVPVTATIAVIFSSRRTPTVLNWDEGSVVFMSLLSRVDMCRFAIHLDRSGNLNNAFDDDRIVLNESDGRKEMSRKEMCGADRTFFLMPESDTPFALIEKKMQEPNAFVFLDSPKYRFLNSTEPGCRRLYYSTMLSGNESQRVQLAGVDTNVKPPKFKDDLSRLATSLSVSPHKKVVYFCTLFVDENGRIVDVESGEGSNDVIEAALSKAGVISPGTLDGKPVPTAVIVAVPAE